jgi:hypothetical protein
VGIHAIASIARIKKKPTPDDTNNNDAGVVFFEPINVGNTDWKSIGLA